MIIQTIDELYNTKIYVKENSTVSFAHPEKYVEPFIQRIGVPRDRFSVKVADPVTNQNDDGSTNIAYPRVVVEADLQHEVSGHQSIIGMLYALDLSKPYISVYNGKIASACTNLHIFNADHLHRVELLGGINSVYDYAEKYFNNFEAESAEFERTIQELTERYFEHEEYIKMLGKSLQYAIKTKKLGTSAVIFAANQLEDSKSKYSLDDNGGTTAWNLFGAMTQYVTDKVSIIEKPSKTLEIAKLFTN